MSSSLKVGKILNVLNIMFCRSQYDSNSFTMSIFGFDDNRNLCSHDGVCMYVCIYVCMFSFASVYLLPYGIQLFHTVPFIGHMVWNSGCAGFVCSPPLATSTGKRRHVLYPVVMFQIGRDSFCTTFHSLFTSFEMPHASYSFGEQSWCLVNKSSNIFKASNLLSKPELINTSWKLCLRCSL